MKETTVKRDLDLFLHTEAPIFWLKYWSLKSQRPRGNLFRLAAPKAASANRSEMNQNEDGGRWTSTCRWDGTNDQAVTEATCAGRRIVPCRCLGENIDSLVFNLLNARF
jgi:hypothetical protein